MSRTAYSRSDAEYYHKWNATEAAWWKMVEMGVQVGDQDIKYDGGDTREPPETH